MTLWLIFEKKEYRRKRPINIDKDHIDQGGLYSFFLWHGQKRDSSSSSNKNTKDGRKFAMELGNEGDTQRKVGILAKC